MKIIVLDNAQQTSEYIELLRKTASLAELNLDRLISDADGLDVLQSIKFKKLGLDPLNPSRDLNLIEQVNQTFTCLLDERIFIKTPVINMPSHESPISTK